MQRRTFIKLTGVAGILAAHRAPAFAQGSKVHVVRWVDFIPEADVELKRQAPEASKALGAEVQFEFINANDLQPRITAGIQSGSGADIFQMLYNWPQLYANGLVDVSDVAEAVSRAQGGFYDAFDAAAKVGGRWLAVLVARGDRPDRISQDDGRLARGGPKAQGQGQAGRPGARAQLRRSADLRVRVPVELRGRRDGSLRQACRPQFQGHGGVGEISHSVLEGRVRRGRARLGRHEQQP